MNRIDHPSLVQVSDYGQLPDGMAYIVMEYLKGETLGQRMKQRRLPIPDVIRFGRQICTGLAAAHEKEIVHRDLKPDNRTAECHGKNIFPQARTMQTKSPR